MKFRFVRTIPIFSMVLVSLYVAPLLQGQEATLTLTVPPELVLAGGKAGIWLNALNATSHEISWTFPPRIEGKLISTQGTFDGSMELLSDETNAVVIVPGGFVRQEYVCVVPAEITGQVVVEFSGLKASRTVLDVQAPARVARKAGRKLNATFAEFIKEAEPNEGLDPGGFFKAHVSGYEPLYFIVGTRSPNAKFQISFAYQLLNLDSPLATKAPFLKGFHLAYTQTSLWDLNDASTTFFDTSYKPEFFYAWKNVTRAQPTNWFQLDLQTGLKHESNGKGGLDSRSFNIGYFQPGLIFGRSDRLQLTVQPRGWIYLGDVSDNRDIADYRGYVDLRTTLGWKRGLQLSALGRMGHDGNHGSVQLDLTYPTMRLFGSFSLYLDVQYFNGYGESLLGYRQNTEAFRIGFALFR